MFSVTNIIGVVPLGSLQPSQIQIAGLISCPTGSGGGIDVELRVAAPPGAPTTVFSATSSTGGPGGPLGSVLFVLPAWTAAVCGAKIIFEVRDNCGGSWSAWDRFEGEIDCLGCPRISLQPPVYGACTGTPPNQLQTVTLTATVMLPPGASVVFTWEFGDTQTATAGTLTNSTANWNNPQTLTISHQYDPSMGPYTACLTPSASSECPRVCVQVQPDCVPVACPAMITGMASIGTCAANGSRPVTYTLTPSPAVPANSMVSVSWAYGGPNVAGQTTFVQMVNTTGGPVSSITHTTDLMHRPGGYATTATVVVQLPNGQLCTIIAVPIPVDPGACLPCPDPMDPVTVKITTPTSATWCAPVAAGLAASLSAQVNWAQPAPTTPPSPVRYDWTVTLPDGRVATQTTLGPTVDTSAGWSGPGSVNGAIDLNGQGTYAVGVAPVFAPTSGLPTDSSGAIACQLVGSASFSLASCPSATQCPTLTGLSVTSACADPAAGITAAVTATVTVNDPAGIVQKFVWDFDDPGSLNNHTVTSSPVASHTYASPRSYNVTVQVQSSTACNGNASPSMSATVAIGTCRPPSRIGCDALLWIALIMIALSGVLAVIGCVISNAYPQVAAILGYIALGLLVTGLLLFLLWWAICRFFTACAVLIAALNFMGILIVVFAVVGTVLAFIAKFKDPSYWVCVGVSFFQSALWGVLLYLLYKIGVAVKCIVENPGGGPPPPATSSSSGLSGAGSNLVNEGRDVSEPVYRATERRGLGDVVTAMTGAMGMAPCRSCHERAERLNRWVGVRRPGDSHRLTHGDLGVRPASTDQP